MPNSASGTKTESAFTILELALLILLLSAVSVMALPRLLVPRLRFNEENALRLLRELASSRDLWAAKSGSPPPLWSLSRFLDQGEAPRPPRDLMPLGFEMRPDGAVLRSGYRFHEGLGGKGTPVGCWAWPKLPGYSGTRVFWLSYADGGIQPFLGRLDGIPGRAPDPDSLGEALPSDP